MNLSGKCQILKIYISEDTQYKGHQLYHALVLKMKEMGMAGVTVTRGIEGYGKGQRIRTMRILELSSNLPIIVEVVDRVENIAAAIPVIEEMVNEGLVLVSDVQVIKYGRDQLPTDHNS